MRKLLVLIAILVPLSLAACGDDDEETTTAATEEATTDTSGTASGGGETVDISETEFALDPSEAAVAAGEVTFAVTNDGNTSHNLEVEGNGIEEVSDTIEPGASTDLAVSLDSGTYEMYCAIGDHREQGMEGEVTVE